MYPPARGRWRSAVVQPFLWLHNLSQLLSLWLQVQCTEERKEEGGGSVQTWCRVFFSPLLPLKCDCPLLRRNWVFQEQPSLSKLALRATGHMRTPLGSFGPFLVCKSWGGASELRIHISGSAWWGGWRAQECSIKPLLIYSSTQRQSE